MFIREGWLNAQSRVKFVPLITTSLFKHGPASGRHVPGTTVSTCSFQQYHRTRARFTTDSRRKRNRRSWSGGRQVPGSSLSQETDYTNRTISWFYSITPGKFWGSTLKLSHHRLLPHPFHFFINLSSFNSKLKNPRY